MLVIAIAAAAYLNVNGTTLQHCSGPGMALTGFTRSGECIDRNDDAGSHHICIDMKSNGEPPHSVDLLVREMLSHSIRLVPQRAETSAR